VNPELFEHDRERELHAAHRAVAQRVDAAVSAGDYATVFHELAELAPTVDALFEAVMVMAEDPAVRANRVALLGETQGIFAPIADLSRLS